MKILVCVIAEDSLIKSRSELIKLFADRGHEIVIASPMGLDTAKYFPDMPVSSRKYRVNKTGLNPFKDIDTYSDLRLIVKKEKPDMVYSFSGAKAVIYAGLAAGKARVTATVNGIGSIFRIDNFKYRIIRAVMTVLYKRALKRAETVFFQNTDDMSVFVDSGIVKREKCFLVSGAGVNLDRFEETPLPDSRVFLFIGRMLRDKGIFEFVDAAKQVRIKYPDAEFWAVGPTDTNPQALSDWDIAKLTEDGTIRYFGHQNDVLPFYKQCYAFVLPSYHEGMPRTVLEAMAVGRPIVTTDAPGCRDSIEDGVSGFLVPVGDASAVAEKLIALIEDRPLAEKMGKAARARAKDTFDVHTVNKIMADKMGL